MKRFFLLAAVLMFSVIVTGCDKLKERRQQHKPAPAAAQPAHQQPVRPAASQARQEAAGVADYAIGAAQIQAGQKMKNKIQNINNQHNKELEDALK